MGKLAPKIAHEEKKGIKILHTNLQVSIAAKPKKLMEQLSRVTWKKKSLPQNVEIQ